jgi:tRNA pseudouridine55 synthase
LASGLVLIDKPEGWTSHDVVAKIRRLAGTRKVGHAGTLDPMATGLLILGVESATKLLTFIVGDDKTYRTTIRLGAATITDDRESEVIEQASPDQVLAIELSQIKAEIQKLTGDIEQVPSSVSAIKVDGRRAYSMVRSGQEVVLKARPVNVSRFEITAEPRKVTEGNQEFLDIDVVIDCSSGTYIRALARDLGKALGVGGHLTALRRTRIGGYSVDSAQSIDALVRDVNPESLQLMPIAQAAAAQFKTRSLSAQDVTYLRHGKRLPHNNEDSAEFAGIDQSGHLVAILQRSGSQVKSVVVFAEEQTGK